MDWDRALIIDSQILTHTSNNLQADKLNKTMALVYNGVSVAKISANLHEATK